MNLVQKGDRNGPKNQGMTLVETMIAVLILGIFMAGAFGLVSSSTKQADMARNHYVAVTICRNRLETARTMGFDSLTSLRETATICNSAGGADPEGTYKRMTDVITGYLASTNLAQVKVTVVIRNSSTQTFSNSNNYETVQSLYTRH